MTGVTNGIFCTRRKGKRGNEYEAQSVGCQNPIEENSCMR